MSTHWLPIVQEQRLEVLGTLRAGTTDVWVGLHGYGQLVAFFCRHFRDAVAEHRAFVLPQAPHKFYLNGLEGRVGASWMTKEDRLIDIQNQKEYLNALFTWILAQAPNARIHVVAFSQGVATAMRFLGKSEHTIHSIIAWAGSWPPDLGEAQVQALRQVNFKGYFGTNDPYIGAEKQRAILDRYRNEYALELKVETYEGGHSFDAQKLLEAIEELELNKR
jgi:predicted esterase